MDKKTNTPKMIEGYVGAAKGIAQVLWERGLWIDGMTTDGTYTKNKQKIQQEDRFNMKLVLSQQPDFAAAKSALTEFVEGLGQLLDMSPKLHPEVAGVGIEYCWAVAKQEFRAKNDFQIKTPSARVQHSLTMPSIPVVHNCARRARDYERACRAPLDDGTATELQHRQIEAQKKEVKKHRDALDFSGEWAKAQRSMEAARQAARPAR